jgi:hypothetical protein
LLVVDTIHPNAPLGGEAARRGAHGKEGKEEDIRGVQSNPN